ncbi:MAG TPA: putative baseplate assembly protein [Micromonosporaceae bacterium]|nr:putative baseplate assembly protein [Micromonosporaceae bacterium]
MSLPTPNLDDRTFQELVDEAKRHVQRRCPSWTNHNVSDPGVTLIEAFAWMTDLLLYRLNRVPDRHYVKFLELLGVSLFPPAAARAEVSFRLSSHQDVAVRIAAGTVVSTRRTATEHAVAFATTVDLEIVPGMSRVVATQLAGREPVDRTPGMGVTGAFACFAERPEPGDALYIGLDRPAPANLVLLQFVCTVGGHGIDPHHPPIVWEAWNGDGWVRCDVERDTTLGLNVSGAVELHLPAGHATSAVGGAAAAWLRCRVIELPGYPAYRSTPLVVSVTAATVGGDVEAINGDPVGEEVLGRSDGTAGQSFFALRPPVLPVPGEPLILDVGTPAGRREEEQESGWTGAVEPIDDPDAELPVAWQEWTQVESFADSAPDSRHFTVDATTGEVRFGPAVRQSDGTVRRYGAVPAKGAVLRLAGYRTGGGSAGNVAAGTLNVLRSSIPYVASVYNRRPAAGGVDGETIEEAKRRGPVELRSRNRAVTAEDFEQLTRQAAPEFARVRCVPVTTGPDAGGVRILVVPGVRSDDGRIPLGRLRPPEAVRERVVRALDERRVVGVRANVEPPSYVGVRVDARVRCRPDADPQRIESDAVTALFGYFNPLTGGPDGRGWPFGRPVQVGEVYAVLGRVGGIDFVDEAVLFRVNPVTGELSDPQDRIELEPTHLVFSVEHQVYATAEQGSVR